MLAYPTGGCDAVRLRAMAARDPRSLSVSIKGTRLKLDTSHADKLQRCLCLETPPARPSLDDTVSNSIAW